MIQHSRLQRSQSAAFHSRRTGAAMVCVLVCLGIATTIMLVSVRSTLQVRRQMRQELQLEQTRWLVEAGMTRATALLQEQPTYQGETWRVDSAFESYSQAVVEIAVVRHSDNPDQAQLKVTARVRGPDPTDHPTQRSGTMLVDLKSPSNES